MTLPPIERYAGREQAYVKHYFLATYMERLVHKVVSAYSEFVYVDGFSGPWQSADENFNDTSFGIALQALQVAKKSWQKSQPDLKMKAILVEKSPKAFGALQGLQEKYPGVQIKTFRADFLSIVDKIFAEIPNNAFVFFRTDPKGWRIPVRKIEQLLRRPNSEVLFNFMFEFINRAVSMSTPAIVAGLDELLPIGHWRESLAAVEAGTVEDRTRAREKVLIDAFREVLRVIGNYRYVAEVAVLRPGRDRLLYTLVYATRNATGIEVFRDSQIKTLTEQDTIRSATKAKASGSASQSEMFGAPEEMGPDLTQQFLRDERAAASRALIEIAPKAPATIAWDELWPRVLALHAVRRTDLNQIAAQLRNENRLVISDWQSRQRVPHGANRVQRT